MEQMSIRGRFGGMDRGVDMHMINVIKIEMYGMASSKGHATIYFLA